MEKLTQFFDALPRIERKEGLRLLGLAAATSLVYASYKVALLVENKKKKRSKEVPMPGSAYPYVGHMFSLGEYPGEKVTQWHQELGPIIQLRMGVQTWIMVDDPLLAHKIFVTNGMYTSYRPHCTYGYHHYALGGKGMVFNQPGPVWKEARSAALSILAPKEIEKYMDTIQAESTALVDRLLHHTSQNGSTNPIKFFELSAMNVIFQAGFGKKFASVDDPEFVKLSGMIELSIQYSATENDLANFLPIFSVIDYLAGTQVKFKDFIGKGRNPVVTELIQEASKRDGTNLVKSLESDEFELSPQDKMVFMSDLMAAGTDTISVTFAWNIILMCVYPEVQQKAATEIDEFIKLNNRLPHFNERSELPYCISVMKECMRYKPTSPFGVPHNVREDIEVDGYIIPAGATLLSSMESMHKNADLYPEPEKFLPERFMNNLKTMQAAANGKLEDRDHYNFGWGRRICPAIYLAEVELFSAFVRLLSRCIIEPAAEGPPTMQVEKNAGLTAMPAPFKVKFTKRIDSLVD